MQHQAAIWSTLTGRYISSLSKKYNRFCLLFLHAMPPHNHTPQRRTLESCGEEEPSAPLSAPPPPHATSRRRNGTRWSSAAAITAWSPPPTWHAPASPSPFSNAATSSAEQPWPRSWSPASSSPAAATSTASSAPPSSGYAWTKGYFLMVQFANYLLVHVWNWRELELARHGLKLLKPWASSFTPCLDGRSLLLGIDHEHDHSEISKFSKRDADAYPRSN